MNLREHIGVNFAAMYRTAVQRCFVINQFRLREEQRTGTTLSAAALADTWQKNVQMSTMGEQVTVGLADACITIWNRLFADPACKD